MMYEWARSVNQLALKNSNPKTIVNARELISYLRKITEQEF